MPKFTSRGHNTRNFGISVAATATAQWNTLNGMRVPKANKVCYRLLHFRIHVPIDIRAYVRRYFAISSRAESYARF